MSVVGDVEPPAERMPASEAAGGLLRSISTIAGPEGRESVAEWLGTLATFDVRVTRAQAVQELQALAYALTLIAIERSCPPVRASQLTMELEKSVRGRGRRFLMGLSTGSALPDAAILRERQSMYEQVHSQGLIGPATVLLGACFVDAGLRPPADFRDEEVLAAMELVAFRLTGIIAALVGSGWSPPPV